MLKLLITIITVALLAFVAYHRFAEEPLTARGSIEAGIEQVKRTAKLDSSQEQLLKVQLALTDFMASTGRPPAKLSELVPKYFDSEPKDPLTGDPYPYTVEHNVPKLGAELTGSTNSGQGGSGQQTGEGGKDKGDLDKDGGFVNPNTMEVDSFVYDKTGKRDPFKPYNLSATPEQGPGGSLTAYTLGQLRLTAVIVGPTGERKGIVEDDQGRGYTVNNGSAIGNEGGTVVSIEPNLLKIIVTKRDFTGKETQNVVEMKINEAGPSGKAREPKKK